MRVDAQTPLSTWNLPYAELVFDEVFAVPPPAIFGDPTPQTLGELASRAQMPLADVARRLTEIAEMSADLELSPQELAESLKSRTPWTPGPQQAAADRPADEQFSPDLILLDVREGWEMAICQIGGSIALHEQDFGVLLPILQRTREVVTICHHGIRSYSAAMFLRDRGVPGARSLAGGVEQWARTIDPAMARY